MSPRLPVGVRESGARLFGGRARLRWIHLILGGALAMPYTLVGEVVVGPLSGSRDIAVSLPLQAACLLTGLPLAALTALFPLTRPMSAGAVRTLCGVAPATLADRPADTAGARGRTVVWYLLHLTVGAVISALTLAVPPYAVYLALLPFVPSLRDFPTSPARFVDPALALLSAPFAGAALLVLLAALTAKCAALLARAAPVLLGPTPQDRLALAERRAADLAVRNRLARELHDSVGHALSAVTLQAGAARRVLDSDPAFVREALVAIEDTARRTVGELDAVLGVLRETGQDRSRAPAPALSADLDALLDRTRAAGLRVEAVRDARPGTASHRLADLPGLLDREGYRIVQEALSNALRHGGGSPVQLHIAADAQELTITVRNPLSHPRAAAPDRRGGGHGLPGLAERARLLGGSTTSGPVDGSWLLRARLPLAAVR